MFSNVEFNSVVNIVKWCLVNECKGDVGVRIKNKVEYIYERFGITVDEIANDILYYWTTFNHEEKYDEEISKLTTFIPFYVDKYLNNLKRKYEKHGMVGEFRRYADASNLAFRKDISQIGISRNNDDGEEKLDFYSFLDYQGLTADCYTHNNPEQSLITKETMELAVKVFGTEEVKVLIGLVDIEDRLKELGVSRATYYRRLAVRKQVFRDLLNAD